MRTPSETLLLRWEDVDWRRGRFQVRSPKTEDIGKAAREVPLFPRLRDVLLDAFEGAEDGAEYVVGTCRDAARNLRTQAHRIIRRAGLDPWPKTFIALRGSRESELTAEYPLGTVAAWFGNTPAVASKHYMVAREADHQRAGKPAQHPAEMGGTARQAHAAAQTDPRGTRTPVAGMKTRSPRPLDDGAASAPSRKCTGQWVRKL